MKTVEVEAYRLNEALEALERLVSSSEVFSREVEGEAEKACSKLPSILRRHMVSAVRSLLTPKPTEVKGFFLAVGGIDRSGKETQCFNPEGLPGVTPITEILSRFGYRVKPVNLPSYDTVLGSLVGAYLRRRGVKYRFAIVGEVESGLAWILWSLDRSQYNPTVSAWLASKGNAVVAKRWTESNLAYHTPFGVKAERILRFERNIVQPDLTLLIDIPVGEAVRRTGDPDLYEERRSYLEEVRRSYSRLAEAGVLGRVIMVNGLGSPRQVNRRIEAVLSYGVPRV